MAQLFNQSDQLASELHVLIDLPLINDSMRIKIAAAACSLSLEHWHAVRMLLQGTFFPSALVVQRAQFEALTRSIWLTYAASEEAIAKFSVELSIESEQAAKNAPSVQDMMREIAQKAPKPAHDALAGCKENSWKALNSYTHAGIHPLRRHQQGYPTGLIHAILCSSNNLAVMTCMQAVVLGGKQPLQKAVLAVAAKYTGCMPPLR